MGIKSPLAADIERMIGEVTSQTSVVALRPLAQPSHAVTPSSHPSPSAPPRSQKRVNRLRPSPRQSQNRSVSKLSASLVGKVRSMGLDRKDANGLVFSKKFSPYLDSVRTIIRNIDREALLASPEKRTSGATPRSRSKRARKKRARKRNTRDFDSLYEDWSTGLLDSGTLDPQKSKHAPTPKSCPEKVRKGKHYPTPEAKHFSKTGPASAPKAREIERSRKKATAMLQSKMVAMSRRYVSSLLAESAIRDGVLCGTIRATSNKEATLLQEIDSLRNQLSKNRSEKARLSQLHERDVKRIESDRKTARFRRRTMESEFEKKKKEMEAQVKEETIRSKDEMAALKEKLEAQARELEKYHSEVERAKRNERDLREELKDSERQYKDAVMSLEMTSKEVALYKAKVAELKTSAANTGQNQEGASSKEKAETKINTEKQEEKAKPLASPKRAFRKPSTEKAWAQRVVSKAAGNKSEDESAKMLQRNFRKSVARRRFSTLVQNVKLEAVIVIGTGCPEVNGRYVRTGAGRDTSYIKHDNKLGTFQVRRLTSTRWVIGGVPAGAPDQDAFQIYFVVDHHEDRKATPPVVGWNLGNVGKAPLPTLELVVDRVEYQRFELIAPGATYIGEEAAPPMMHEVGMYDGVPQFQCLASDGKHMYTMRRIESKQLEQRIWVIARVSVCVDRKEDASHQILYVNVELGALSYPPKSHWYLGQDGSEPAPIVAKRDNLKGEARIEALKSMSAALQVRPKEIQSMFGFPFNLI